MVYSVGTDWNFAFLSYGESWKSHRKTFVSKFGIRKAVDYLELQENLTKQVLRRLLRTPENFLDHLQLYGFSPFNLQTFLLRSQINLKARGSINNEGSIWDRFGIRKRQVHSQYPGSLRSAFRGIETYRLSCRKHPNRLVKEFFKENNQTNTYMFSEARQLLLARRFGRKEHRPNAQ